MRCTVLIALLLLTIPAAPAQGVRYQRLLIKNVIIIDGAGNPARGPFDITIEGNTIAAIQDPMTRENGGSSLAGTAPAGKPDRVIDATGMYVMPGIIDVHSHIQFSRAGIAMPKDYEYKLLLANGITTIRDPGSLEGIDTIVAQAKLSAENRITAPTIVPYAVIGANTPAEARALVRQVKLKGAKGLKVFIVRPDVWAAISEEARALDLPIATDLKIQETDAIAASRYGVKSIEHWYGIPDAAIPGPQAFPDYYNYDNELDRFRWAGDLWRQADSARLSAVLDTMLAHGVTWDPTFAIYEANRDVQRARTQPWFAEYALPAIMMQFEPDASRHGSYFFDWTTADEVRWRENYRIWMRWVREYAARGGNVTVGSDAGFIYELYGFTTIRELEMQQEAGFHPLEVIQHATSNGAKLLGITNTGVVRPGFKADLLIVDGNPLHNFKVLYATGLDVVENGKMVKRGGVKYTIKDGYVFDAPQLAADVRAMVRAAKAAPAAAGAPGAPPRD
jgi:cytosine/adenosine deaminase-related metal-dependent hydrolase